MVGTRLIARCDKKGRIYLNDALRTQYGDRFIIIRGPRALLLHPVPKDAAKDMEALGRPLRRHSIRSIKTRIRKRAAEEVIS